MESITKTKLTQEQITKITQKAFGEDINIQSVQELTDGYFNSAYVINLTNGEKTVLKIAPSKNIKVMRYENNIMDAEVFALRQVYSQGTVPVPKVLYYDKSLETLDCEYYFMEYLEGTPLNKLRENLTDLQYKSISLEAGRYAKSIQSITSPYFGFMSRADKRFSTWSDAFCFMIRDLLEDAADMNVQLPLSYDKIDSLVQDFRGSLESVKTPCLVHKDLWEGNIFVDPETAQITGIVDFERAIFADALLEPVCGFFIDNRDFMESSFGISAMTLNETIRVLLYKIYIFLIMIIECPFRQYSTNDIEKWAFNQLEATLAEIQTHHPS